MVLSPEVPDVVRELRKARLVSLRTKVDTGGWRESPLVGVALATPAGRAWYFPLRHGHRQGELGMGEPAVNLPGLDEDAMRPLVELLQDEAIAKTGNCAVVNVWVDPNEYAPGTKAQTMYK